MIIMSLISCQQCNLLSVGLCCVLCCLVTNKCYLCIYLYVYLFNSLSIYLFVHLLAAKNYLCDRLRENLAIKLRLQFSPHPLQSNLYIFTYKNHASRFQHCLGRSSCGPFRSFLFGAVLDLFVGRFVHHVGRFGHVPRKKRN